MMNRHVVIIDKKDIDIIRKGLKKLGCHISSVSCSQNGYMIIYRSDNCYEIDEIKKFGCL